MSKIGIEIEFISPTHTATELAEHISSTGWNCYAEGYNHRTRNHWKIVTDASLPGRGLELVSPPLEWNDDTREQLTAIMGKLNECGVRVNRACGLHVHHDATNMMADQMVRIVKNYQMAETAIDAVMPQSRRNSQWCRAIPAEIQRGANTWSHRQLANALGTRYRKVNVESYVRHRTIEFRQHSGTTNAAKIIHWVNLTMAIVNYSEHSLFDGSASDITDLLSKLKAQVARGAVVRRGSGYFIRQQLRNTDYNDEWIATMARNEFGGRTTARDVAWNRSQMRNGKFADEVADMGPGVAIDENTEQFYIERESELAA